MSTPAAIATDSLLDAALHRYVEARTAALVAARRTVGLNELDARALLFIASHPGTRPSDVRDYLGITSAGVTTLVDRLVSRLTVRRDVDAADRRVNRLTAIVDLSIEPWSALTRFDEACRAASSAADPGEGERLTSALDAITAAGSRAVTA